DLLRRNSRFPTPNVIITDQTCLDPNVDTISGIDFYRLFEWKERLPIYQLFVSGRVSEPDSIHHFRVKPKHEAVSCSLFCNRNVYERVEVRVRDGGVIKLETADR